MWTHVKEFWDALVAFIHTPTLKRLAQLVIALVVLIAVVFTVLYAQIVGHSVFADIWQAAMPLRTWAVQGTNVPNWQPLVLIALIAYSVGISLFLVIRYIFLTKTRSADAEVTQSQEALESQLHIERLNVDLIRAELSTAEEKIRGFAGAFKIMEAVVNSIVDIADKMVLPIRDTLSVIPSESTVDDIRAQLRAHIDDGISLLLGLIIKCAQGLLGEAVYRGAILLPQDSTSYWLNHYADSGFDPQEKLLRFYIRLHPANTQGSKSVAGAAYWLREPQLCRWSDKDHKFDHPDYSPGSTITAQIETHRSFVVLPLQADYLSMSPSDARVLGVLCFDATNAHAFDDHVVLAPRSNDAPIFSMMRVMYQLLAWRADALETIDMLFSQDGW